MRWSDSRPRRRRLRISLRKCSDVRNPRSRSVGSEKIRRCGIEIICDDCWFVFQKRLFWQIEMRVVDELSGGSEIWPCVRSITLQGPVEFHYPTEESNLAQLLRRQSCILHTRRAFYQRADDWIRTSMIPFTRRTPFSVEPRRHCAAIAASTSVRIRTPYVSFGG